MAPNIPPVLPPEADKVLGFQMEYLYTNYVKNAFVAALREALASEATPKEYRYSQKESDRQIAIYRVFPKRQTMYPCVIVEAEAGDTSISSLGQEEGYEIRDQAGLITDIVYRGTMQIPVKITIMAQTATDREKLTDMISIYIRFVFRSLFLKYNMPYLDIRAGEAGETVEDNKPIYKGEITVRLQTEFAQKIDMRLFDAVLGINLKNVLYGSSNVDLQSNYTPEP